MSKSKAELKNAANHWFTWFESRQCMPHQTSADLVFAFCDYINSLPYWQLAAELETENPEDVQNFKELINNGIEIWLEGLVKSLYIK